MRLAGACRWAAVALAVVAVVDPRVTLPHRVRPAVRVVAGPDTASERALRGRLEAAGFTASGGPEGATVATRDATVVRLPESPLYAIGGASDEPDVSIQRALATAVRVPGQAIAIAVTIRGRRANGQATEVRLDDAGLTVARVSHRWASADETWAATLTYLPAEPGGVPLRVRADVLAGERYIADNAADVLAPAERAPIRALVFAPAVTWPAVFVRRTLEADPAFSVASVQRVTRNAATRGGAPPGSLTRADLEPYEVLLCGTMDLDAAARDAVTWFVERRGGVAVFVPDRVPSRADALLTGLSFESRIVDTPIAIAGSRGALTASELAIPRGLPPLAESLAADAAGTPIVVAVRRGVGAVIISGALDAWRYRDARGFAQFWPAAILAEAAAAPPRLEVSVTPAVVRPGETVRIAATLRPTELPSADREIVVPAAAARAIAPAAHVDVPVGVWPAAQPGRYEGEWRPPVPGEYAVDVSIGALSAAAVLRVDAEAASPPGASGTSDIAARATGGGVFADEASLVTALATRLPRVTAFAPGRPARSPWWAAAFALLLCTEWALRRRRGRP